MKSAQTGAHALRVDPQDSALEHAKRASQGPTCHQSQEERLTILCDS